MSDLKLQLDQRNFSIPWHFQQTIEKKIIGFTDNELTPVKPDGLFALHLKRKFKS